MESARLVSVHGGHSAEFCSHARDRLADIVAAYQARGFLWVGLTEHMPPARDAMIPPEERAAGLDVAATRDRFAAYFSEARRLQRRFEGELEVFVGFEAEIYSGVDEFLASLVREFEPDYFVGSVHHACDVAIDASPELYAEAAARAGGLEGLYCEYFDAQHALLRAFEPKVVGHFDLIRLFDSDYRARLLRPSVWQRVERNLALVKEQGAILDFNARAFAKGQREPYVAAPILARARELGVAVVPGDDSHGVDDVGRDCDRAIQLLVDHGFDIDFDADWARPA